MSGIRIWPPTRTRLSPPWRVFSWQHSRMVVVVVALQFLQGFGPTPYRNTLDAGLPPDQNRGSDGLVCSSQNQFAAQGPWRCFLSRVCFVWFVTTLSWVCLCGEMTEPQQCHFPSTTQLRSRWPRLLDNTLIFTNVLSKLVKNLKTNSWNKSCRFNIFLWKSLIRWWIWKRLTVFVLVLSVCLSRARSLSRMLEKILSHPDHDLSKERFKSRTSGQMFPPQGGCVSSKASAACGAAWEASSRIGCCSAVRRVHQNKPQNVQNAAYRGTFYIIIINIV